jgi:hypothetical protein
MEREKDDTDFHAIPVGIDDKESCNLQKPPDCFSILCGVLAAVFIILLLTILIYYFCTPSIINKK